MAGKFAAAPDKAYAAPDKTLRLRGALGPLQGMGVEGAKKFIDG
jgi:hypothetical protein